MPRGRGGARTGTPGKSYANRTDLAKPKIMAVPGQTYGKQAEQVAAQRELPMARPATDVVPGPAGPAPQAAPLAAPAVLPGQVTPLSAPTERPGEPVTAGVPVGPGPGPEVLGMPQQQGEDLSDILQYLPMLEFMANQPGASSQTRNFVRRLRAAKPVGQ